MRTDALDYFLPPELIAREPARPRDHSRLLVYRRGPDAVEHRYFHELPRLLDPGDLLVANDTRVLPAKLHLRKASGGVITGLFLEELTAGRWRIMLKSRGRVALGTVLTAPHPNHMVELVLRERLAEKGQWMAAVNTTEPARQVLDQIGDPPLPPYIEKARAADWSAGGGDISKARLASDKSALQNSIERDTDTMDYQTVYARAAGAVAAPTAGLHFTPRLLEELTRHGVEREFLTLHVGLGTFLPVQTPRLEDHPMHGEWFTIESNLVERLRRRRAENASGRIVAVGTTTVRALESAADEILDPRVPFKDITAVTKLFIQPGFHFQLTDALITNFHLPRSTLIALVAALVGLPRLKALYGEAVQRGYRFYSFGDAMLILP